MRDAVSLLKKTIVIDDSTYKIIDFYYVPGNSEAFVKLKGSKGTYLNYEYKKLQIFLKEQRIK